MSRKIVINLFGGPGYGKSTFASYLFYKFKTNDVKAELVFEVAKDLIYLTGIKPPFNQAYVFGNQLFKIERYLEQSDVVIVDSPLLFSIIYNNISYLNHSFDETVMAAFNSFNNFNLFLDNEFAYSNQGRFQDESDARETHKAIKEFLDGNQIQYRLINSKNYDEITEEVLRLAKE